MQRDKESKTKNPGRKNDRQNRKMFHHQRSNQNLHHTFRSAGLDLTLCGTHMQTHITSQGVTDYNPTMAAIARANACAPVRSVYTCLFFIDIFVSCYFSWVAYRFSELLTAGPYHLIRFEKESMPKVLWLSAVFGASSRVPCLYVLFTCVPTDGCCDLKKRTKSSRTGKQGNWYASIKESVDQC